MCFQTYILTFFIWTIFFFNIQVTEVSRQRRNSSRHVLWLYGDIAHHSLKHLFVWRLNGVRLQSRILSGFYHSSTFPLCPITGHPAVSPTTALKCLKASPLQVYCLFTYLLCYHVFICRFYFHINQFLFFLNWSNLFFSYVCVRWWEWVPSKCIQVWSLIPKLITHQVCLETSEERFLVLYYMSFNVYSYQIPQANLWASCFKKSSGCPDHRVIHFNLWLFITAVLIHDW